MSLLKKITSPTGANANILICLVVGGVFLNEGITNPEPGTAISNRKNCAKFVTL